MKTTEFFYELAKEIKPFGFRCFLYDHDYGNWLSVITPNGSWLEIFHGYYGGYDITYEYVPSRDFGSGCRYNENALYEITKETLLAAENYGKNYEGHTWYYEWLKDNCGGFHRVRVTGTKKPKHYEDGLKALMESYFGKQGKYVEI